MFSGRNYRVPRPVYCVIIQKNILKMYSPMKIAPQSNWIIACENLKLILMSTSSGKTIENVYGLCNNYTQFLKYSLIVVTVWIFLFFTMYTNTTRL